MATIHIANHQNKIEIDPRKMARVAERILNALDCTDRRVELSIAIVDDPEMQRLNRQYRGVDATTDVLAFPMLEGEYGNIEPEVLGDVVISAPMARRLSELHGCPFDAVTDLLLVHGILHLLGHDHYDSEEAQAMDTKTMELLTTLGHTMDDFAWYLTEQGSKGNEKGEKRWHG